MCNCHSILECCAMFSGVKLSIRSFNVFRRITLSNAVSIGIKRIYLYNSLFKTLPIYIIYIYIFYENSPSFKTKVCRFGVMLQKAKVGVKHPLPSLNRVNNRRTCLQP